MIYEITEENKLLFLCEYCDEYKVYADFKSVKAPLKYPPIKCKQCYLEDKTSYDKKRYNSDKARLFYKENSEKILKRCKDVKYIILIIKKKLIVEIKNIMSFTKIILKNIRENGRKTNYIMIRHLN